MFVLKKLKADLSKYTFGLRPTGVIFTLSIIETNETKINRES